MFDFPSGLVEIFQFRLGPNSGDGGCFAADQAWYPSSSESTRRFTIARLGLVIEIMYCIYIYIYIHIKKYLYDTHTIYIYCTNQQNICKVYREAGKLSKTESGLRRFLPLPYLKQAGKWNIHEQIYFRQTSSRYCGQPLQCKSHWRCHLSFKQWWNGYENGGDLPNGNFNDGKMMIMGFWRFSCTQIISGEDHLHRS